MNLKAKIQQTTVLELCLLLQSGLSQAGHIAG